MKKIINIFVGIIMAVLLVGCNTAESTNKTSNEVKQTSNESSTNNKEKFAFSNETVKYHDGMTEVLGEVKNNDTKKHTFAIRVTFYDNNKQILGTALGTVNDIEGGQTKTFEADATEDFSKSASYKIEVDTVVE